LVDKLRQPEYQAKTQGFHDFVEKHLVSESEKQSLETPLWGKKSYWNKQRTPGYYIRYQNNLESLESHLKAFDRNSFAFHEFIPLRELILHVLLTKQDIAFSFNNGIYKLQQPVSTDLLELISGTSLCLIGMDTLEWRSWNRMDKQLPAALYRSYSYRKEINERENYFHSDGSKTVEKAVPFVNFFLMLQPDDTPQSKHNGEDGSIRQIISTLKKIEKEWSKAMLLKVRNDSDKLKLLRASPFYEEHHTCNYITQGDLQSTLEDRQIDDEYRNYNYLYFENRLCESFKEAIKDGDSLCSKPFLGLSVGLKKTFRHGKNLDSHYVYEMDFEVTTLEHVFNGTSIFHLSQVDEFTETTKPLAILPLWNQFDKNVDKNYHRPQAGRIPNIDAFEGDWSLYRSWREE
jgi:hypothetical protein